jgi:hypothetical protein
MKVERTQLLEELRTVAVGLAEKKTVEQSDCFVFQKGEAMTYNDEVACRIKSSLAVTGAVNARKMLDMLDRSNDETIEFKQEKGRLSFRGKKKRGFFKIEKKILLPITDVKSPKKWTKLPPKLAYAVGLVQGCAAHKTPALHLCCVNITSKWVEACDGTQAGRCTMPTPFENPTLIKQDVAKQILSQDVNRVGFTRNWVHFRNKTGLIISCHVYKENYPSERLTKIFKTKGKAATLPKQLKSLTERVRVFLDDKAETQWLQVQVTPKYIQVTGEGTHGQQTERAKIKYKGKPIGFSIHPDLLKVLTSKHDKCEISDSVIKIQRDNFEYVTSLWIPDGKDK